MRWIRAKYERKLPGWGCQNSAGASATRDWRFACNGVVFTGAASVAGDPLPLPRNTIPTP